LTLIYETIPCNDVTRKPTLSYKLSNAAAKAPAISLSNEDDWNGVLEMLADAEAMKKKRAGQQGPAIIPVNIIVPEVVSSFFYTCSCRN
jgi:hypothetical protein